MNETKHDTTTPITTPRIRRSRLLRSLRRGAFGLSMLALATGCTAGKDEAPSEKQEQASVAVPEESGEASADEAAPMAAGQLAPTEADGGTPEGGETFTDYGVNPWTKTVEDRLSTFAVDVDTASYTIARRMITDGRTPPPASVRVEEFVNYFGYDYAAPPADAQMPFEVTLDGAASPFAQDSHIVRVGVQGKQLSAATRKPANLTFLVDVSGSMSSADKLGLAKRALRLLVDQLQEGDTVSLVTYAGSTRVVLEPTGMDQKGRIHAALEELTSGGSTAMASGIDLAYEQALSAKTPGSINRVIVVSDGDGNVGPSGHDVILERIAGYVDQGITVSTIGVGMGNYRDTTMEQLANKGNGNNYYFDDLNQARKVFVEQLGGTLQVIARDVKIQVEFDPAAVESYRLIGYENRDVADQDFRNDAVDAGEIGAGHSVTALYEIKLSPEARAAADAPTLATVRIRHEDPDAAADAHAVEHTWTMTTSQLAAAFEQAHDGLRFATTVATFAEVLRQSPHAPAVTLEQLAGMASGANNGDPERQAFVELVLAADAKGLMARAE